VFMDLPPNVCNELRGGRSFVAAVAEFSRVIERTLCLARLSDFRNGC